MPTPAATKRLLRLALGTLLLGSLIYLCRHFSIPSCSEIQSRIEAWGVAAPLLFALAYVVATVAFVPGLVLTLVAGLAFGPWWGTLVVAIAANVGAVLAFLAGRFFARDLVESLLRKQAWFGKFKSNFNDHGLNYVLFIRLVPIFPFNGLNYACGLVPLKLRDFVLGSLVGMLPGTFAYVYLGAAGCGLIDAAIQGHLRLSDLPAEVRDRLLIAIALLAVLSLLPLALKRVRGKPGLPS